MQRALLTAAIFGITAALVAGIWWRAMPEVERSERTTTLRYAFEIRNTRAVPVAESELRLFAPADVPGRQRLVRLDVNAPHRVHVDDFGNRTLEITLAKLPPHGSRIVVVDAEVTSYDPPLPGASTDLGPYLAAEPKVQADHASIRAQARALTAQSDDPLRDLFRWVARSVDDIGYVTEDRGALYALEQRQGDCTEFMTLYSALARSLEIPTRNVAGFVVRGASGRLDGGAYHNWAEAYDGRRWLLVDAQNEIFDAGYHDYVIFRVLTPETQLSNTQRFYAADSRLQVRMQ